MPLAAGQFALAEIDSALAEVDRTDGEAVVSIWYGESAQPTESTLCLARRGKSQPNIRWGRSPRILC